MRACWSSDEPASSGLLRTRTRFSLALLPSFAIFEGTIPHDQRIQHLSLRISLFFDDSFFFFFFYL